MDALDVFHPNRMADRILGMGDVVSLVEKASQDLSEENLKKNKITVNMFRIGGGFFYICYID